MIVRRAVDLLNESIAARGGPVSLRERVSLYDAAYERALDEMQLYRCPLCRRKHAVSCPSLTHRRPR